MSRFVENKIYPMQKRLHYIFIHSNGKELDRIEKKYDEKNDSSVNHD